jgi:hypothetical protein
MKIPAKIPGLQLATALLALYAAVWISLEGALWQVMVMGVGVTAVALLHFLQKQFGGQLLSLWKWLGLTTSLGLLLGLGSSLLTLVFMAVKTGLHAHGPEFTLQEIQWVGQQLPLWAAAGLLIGLGMGMLTGKQS